MYITKICLILATILSVVGIGYNLYLAGKQRVYYDILENDKMTVSEAVKCYTSITNGH